MSERARFREILRRLAMIDEAFVSDQAGLGLGPAGTTALDARTAAARRVGRDRVTSSLPGMEHSPGDGRGRE